MGIYSDDYNDIYMLKEYIKRLINEYNEIDKYHLYGYRNNVQFFTKLYMIQNDIPKEYLEDILKSYPEILEYFI